MAVLVQQEATTILSTVSKYLLFFTVSLWTWSETLFC